MREEKWKRIEGYDRYEVSTHGRVRSRWRGSEWRILKPARTSKGYLSVVLYSEGRQKRHGDAVTVHRLVLSHWGDDQPGKELTINHKDLDKTNNHIENLEWMSRGQNVRHAVENGHATTGETNGRCRLTESDVVRLRDRCKDGRCCATRKRLTAIQFGINRDYLNQILRQQYRKSG